MISGDLLPIYRAQQKIVRGMCTSEQTRIAVTLKPCLVVRNIKGHQPQCMRSMAP